MVAVMQFRENLTDRQAANAVRARIDWKYVLCLDLEDTGFNYSVLRDFLSAREMAGLPLIAVGQSNQAIAEQLCLALTPTSSTPNLTTSKKGTWAILKARLLALIA